MKKYHYILIFLGLALLVLISYGKSLGLSLYGDDWLTISKYYGNYGPHGKTGGYFDGSVVFSNYGFQLMSTAFLYTLFKDNAVLYFYVSLFCRTLLAFSIFLFTKRLISLRTGFVASTLFAISSIGAETTDWVYNFSSYIAIAVSLIGLIFFIKRANIKDLILAWLFLISSYVMVIIRLFILPFLLIAIEFSTGVTNKHFDIKNLPKILFWSILVFIPFYLIKIFFPGLGFQQVNQYQLMEGYKLATSFISKGQWDFIVTPFTNLGIMIAPIGFEQLKEILIPGSKSLLIEYVFLFILGTALVLSCLKNINKAKTLVSGISVFLILSLLKIFLSLQHSNINEFVLFSQTFLGLIFTLICLILIINAFRSRNRFELAFYITGIILTFSFLFPWSYSPGSISAATGRYNIVPSVGIALILSGLLTLRFSKINAWDKFRYFAQLIIIIFFVLIQILNSNNYFSKQLLNRNRKLNDTIFRQIKTMVPILSEEESSLFYFEQDQPQVYENLLRFGFGYHMQLLYNLNFDEQRLSFSVNSKEDLIAAMTDPEFTKRLGYHISKVDNVFAFRLLGDNLENITPEMRSFLSGIKK